MADVWANIEAARVGKSLVSTNGVFDILHAGHVDYLERARALGDLLVVAVNSDESVRRLGKGDDRPINPLEDRMRVLAALRSVDFVVPFLEETPVDVLRRLRPDIHVKGGDYRAEDLPETPVVIEAGGRIEILSLVPGRSTTEILRRARST